MTAPVRRTLPVTVILAAGLLGTALVGTAAAATTTVTGTVKTSTGSGVAGVKVTAKVGAASAVVATTDSQGKFTMNVDTGAATLAISSAASNAVLPKTWAFNGIGTSIVSNAKLNFTLPTTTNVAVKVTRSSLPLANVGITQCTVTNTAEPAVVLPGAAAVAPTQDFVGSTTDTAGMVTLKSFRDATLGRLCARFSTTDNGGSVTTYAARGPIRDATVDTSMTIPVPAVSDQSGTVKDSKSLAKSGVKVAIRSASGQVDSASAPTTAGGAFSTQVAAGDVFARISSSSLSPTAAPPTNIPRSFKATFDATSGATWAVNLPATATLNVKVVNADGSPVSGAIVRPITTGAFDTANTATLVAGASPAIITQQIYSDGFSDALGITSVRLFADSSLDSFRVIKNIGGGVSRQTVVPAGVSLTAAKEITVTLPPAA